MGEAGMGLKINVFLSENRLAFGFCLGIVLALFGWFIFRLILGPSNILFTARDRIGLIEIARQAMPERMARLDTPAAQLVSSYDRMGGNNDYNNFLRKGPEGWVTLADLRGPGYVSRFWFTGASNGQHRIRFFFDGERKARIDASLDEWCGGADPFRSPLANYENYCWYSFVPVPYAKRLVVMAQEGDSASENPPKLFYQIAYSTLPNDQRVESYPTVLSGGASQAIAEVNRRWLISDGTEVSPSMKTERQALVLKPGAVTTVFQLGGPAILRRLRITPDYSAISSSSDREDLLRDLVLRISWNQNSFPSVEVPLGDFFGSVWQRARFQSMFFGLTNDTFVSRFPMPFESNATLQIGNDSRFDVPLVVLCDVEPMNAWTNHWGYFHSGWQRTEPSDIGRPHPILQVKGGGKYVGCVLAVTSADKSFWILEGDESIRIDQETEPGWKGTGLEDYFNGGWYYQNVLARPLNGLTFKAPFRTVQYRLHLTDPILFRDSLDMFFERGPDQNSHGWMESVAFYYMDQPKPAFARLGSVEGRAPPTDPMEPATLMTELWNYERYNDYGGAREFIDRYLQKHPDFPLASVLRLRQIAYDEKMNGFLATKAAYEKFIAAETNDMALNYARMLVNFQTNPSNAILIAYANTDAKVFLDGKMVGEAGDAARTMAWPVTLASGTHVLAVAARWKPYPDWLQMGLRTHHGLVVSAPDWKFDFQHQGHWAQVDYDDRTWRAVGGIGVKGPPEEPYIWVEPTPFVDMQSKAVGLRTSREWPDKKGYVVFRKTFVVP